MEKQFRLLWIPVLLFICFFLTVGFFNRFASDDFEFLDKFNNLGFTGSVKYFYDHWNTRWVAIGFMNIVFIVKEFTGSIVWYHLFSIVLLWLGFYRLVSGLLNVSIQKLLIISGFGALCFFYSCFSISDVFFWINTSTMYLFGTIAFLFAIAELVRKEYTIRSCMILCISGFYLGGAYEPLVFTSMVIMICVLLYNISVHKLSAFRQILFLKSLIFLSVLMIAFAISYSGEGHVIRATFLPQTTVYFKIWVLIKAVLKMMILYLPVKLFAALLLSLPWFLLGTENSLPSITGKIVAISFGVLFVLIILSLAPVAFVMSEMGPERAWTQISLFISFFAAIAAVWLGTNFRQQANSKRMISFLTFSICILIVATGIWAVSNDSKYSKAHDSRMEELARLKFENKTGVAVIEPLPNTYWLHSSEISEDSIHFTNKHLKNYLQLNFEVQKEGTN